MILTNLFKKRSFKNLAEKINSGNIKKIKENKTKNIVEETLQQIDNHIESISVSSNRTLTFIRLETLEAFSTWATTTMLDNQANIIRLKVYTEEEFKKVWEAIKGFDPTSLKADIVLDTSDGVYKNVKDIVINKAEVANKALFTETTGYANVAGVAQKVVYANGVHTVDDVMLNYVPKSTLKEVLSISNTYEQFVINMGKAL